MAHKFHRRASEIKEHLHLPESIVALFKSSRTSMTCHIILCYKYSDGSELGVLRNMVFVYKTTEKHVTSIFNRRSAPLYNVTTSVSIVVNYDTTSK